MLAATAHNNSCAKDAFVTPALATPITWYHNQRVALSTHRILAFGLLYFPHQVCFPAPDRAFQKAVHYGIVNLLPLRAVLELAHS